MPHPEGGRELALAGPQPPAQQRVAEAGLARARPAQDHDSPPEHAAQAGGRGRGFTAAKCCL